MIRHAPIAEESKAASPRLRPMHGIDHLDLVGSDLERSLAFYRGLLEPLGYDRASEIVGEQGERVVYLHGQGVVPVSVRAATTPGDHDRYRVGLHHLAFQAPSREVVDERLGWARAQGVEIENDPKEYDYESGYYAGFFRDPDGIKLEVVHVSAPSAR
jgi:catechol 2,3-dioxygenase-like lactoylglutathione lyase family enzyme